MNESAELSVEEGYTRWAALYDDDGNPLIALEGPLVQGWLGPIQVRRALDLGCGTGRHTKALVSAGAIVSAADLTLAMLLRAREKLASHSVGWLRAALPGPLPFADATFQLVVMGLVAEHLTDLRGSLREVSRVLEPKGRLILTALHPDRTAEGQRARFIDPDTGERTPIATIHRSINEYCKTADSVGLVLIEQRSLTVAGELADRLPRAMRYVGKNLGWGALFEAN